MNLIKTYYKADVEAEHFSLSSVVVHLTSPGAVARYALYRNEGRTRYDSFKKAFCTQLEVEDSPEGFAAVCAAMDLFEATEFFKNPNLVAIAKTIRDKTADFEKDRASLFMAIERSAEIEDSANAFSDVVSHFTGISTAQARATWAGEVGKSKPN